MSEPNVESQNDSLEPLFTLDVSAELIPFSSKRSLVDWLSKHPEFSPRYRRAGGRYYRMLYQSELIKIREMLMSSSRPGGNAGSGPISNIIRRAMAR